MTTVDKHKHYGLMFSAHGSSYKLDVFDNECPPNPKRYAKATAIRKARHWESFADTVGGRACVIDLHTNNVINHYK